MGESMFTVRKMSEPRLKLSCKIFGWEISCFLCFFAFFYSAQALAAHQTVLLSQFEYQNGQVLREVIREDVSAALDIRYADDFGYILLEDGTAALVSWSGTGSRMAMPDCVDNVPVTALGLPGYKLVVPLVPANTDIVSWPKNLKYVYAGAIRLGNCQSYSFPEGILELECFSDTANYTLKSITLPGTVKKIGTRAFAFFMKLEKLALPDSIEEIGTEAFYRSGIKKLSCPGNMRCIGTGAFYGCSALETLTLNEGLQFILPYAFSDCTNLTTLVVPSTVQEIGDSAFSGCRRLYGLYLRQGALVTIGERAFQGLVWLRKIEVPEGVREIRREAFAGCTRLASLTLPASLTEIGENIFERLPDEAVFYAPSSSWIYGTLLHMGRKVKEGK